MRAVALPLKLAPVPSLLAPASRGLLSGALRTWLNPTRASDDRRSHARAGCFLRKPYVGTSASGEVRRPPALPLASVNATRLRLGCILAIAPLPCLCQSANARPACQLLLYRQVDGGHNAVIEPRKLQCASCVDSARLYGSTCEFYPV